LLGGITSEKPRYYRLQDGGWLVGRYQQNCGGCDTIRSQDEVKQRVLEGYIAGARYVLFEGLMITSSFQPWYDFSRPLGGMLWIYLDTPLDLCLKRVWARTGHDPNVRGNVKHKHIETLRQLQKTAVCGDRVAVLHYEDYIAEFEKLMQVYQ
jgi:hypothetical protein